MAHFMRSSFSRQRLLKGFTLIELLVVITIVGILAGGVITIINPATQLEKARNTTRKNHLKELSSALEIYANENGVYPVSTWCDVSSCLQVLAVSKIIKSIPKDPRTGQSFPPCNNAAQVVYRYYSDGSKFKLIAQCGLEGRAPSSSDPYYDPQRPTTAWQISSPGAAW
jgi:prepilin-type N-terminal cleavage/methylation domain-containing protein